MTSPSMSPDSGDKRPGPEERKLRTFTRMYREAGPYLALGVQLAATVVIMFFVGFWADEHFGTKPWLMIGGLAVGAAAGFYNFFRTVTELGKKEEEK